MAVRPSDADPSDYWPDRAATDDPLDDTSDDTFTEEVTILVKPRRAPSAPVDDVIWPPPTPSIPADAETAEPVRRGPTWTSPSPPARPTQTEGPGLDQPGLDQRRGVDPASGTDVLALDRAPVITQPWSPMRHRALDPDAIVRQRRGWSAWLPVVVVLVGTVLVVALVANYLLAAS